MIDSINQQFIQECRSRGQLTIDDAMEIANSLGLFDGDKSDIVLERAQKQKIRNLLSGATRSGERTIRSVKLENGRFYIDLLNPANIVELNMLINAENRRIKQSKSIVRSLKRVRHMIEGQLSLEDIFQEAL